jgi:hypothetical protein
MAINICFQLARTQHLYVDSTRARIDNESILQHPVCRTFLQATTKVMYSMQLVSYACIFRRYAMRAQALHNHEMYFVSSVMHLEMLQQADVLKSYIVTL